MPNVTGRSLLGCVAITAGVLPVVLVAVPFTRVLTFGFVRGEPIDEDLRPLSYYIRRLSDPDKEVVTDATSKIAGFGDRGTPAIPALIELARDPVRGAPVAGKPNPRNPRIAALVTIGRMGPAAAGAVPDLVSFLSHPDTSTRIVVLETLKKIGRAAVADPRPLAAALHDEDIQVRYEASWLLDEYATDFFINELNKLLASNSSQVRYRACDWAKHPRLSYRELLPALRKCLSDPDPDVQREAEEAIEIIENVQPPE